MNMESTSEPSSRRTWTVDRIIALSLAAFLMGLGMMCVRDGLQSQQDFERWLTAKPVEGDIDLSAPGEFVFQFNQTCSISHGESVSLLISPESFKDLTVDELLAGLNARLEIIEQVSNTIVTSASFDYQGRDELVNRVIPIFNIAPFRKGTYEATVTVTGGATKLKGVAQRIEGNYQLCGLEKLPAQIALILGGISLSVGILVGLILAFRIAKDRRPSTLP